MRPATAAAALLLLLSLACSDRSPAVPDLVLVMATADGLETGSPVLFNDKEVGRVTSLVPGVSGIEASVELKKNFRPSRSARFLLARGEKGKRVIHILDERTSAEKISTGEKFPVQMSPESLEGRLWISK